MNSINSIKDMCNLPSSSGLNNGQNQDKHGRFDFLKMNKINNDCYRKVSCLLC